MKFIGWITYPLWWILCRFPFFKYMSLGFQVDKLVHRGKIEEAKSLRREWLEKIPEKYAAELWRSEGEYLLYTAEDYVESFKAFKNSVRAFESNQSFNDPLRLYYSAAVSAVMNNEIDLAEDYFNKFLADFNEFGNGMKMHKYTSKFAPGVKWLRDHIYGDGERSHLRLVDNPYESI